MNQKPQNCSDEDWNKVCVLKKKKGRRTKEEQSFMNAFKAKYGTPKKKASGRKVFAQQQDEEQVQQNDFQRNIIAHLPVHNNDVKTMFRDEQFLQYNPKVSEPIPQDDNLINGFPIDNVQWVKPYHKNTNKTFAEYPFNEQKENDESINSMNQDLNEDEFEQNNNINQLNFQESPQIIYETNKINFKHQTNWYYDNIHEKSKVEFTKDMPKAVKTMNGASSNDGSYWPMNTLVHCFWCCYPFRNIPIAIPYKKIENTFYGRGNFCSFECAHRFIVETIQNDVERQRVRVLLHHLRSLMIPDQGLKQIPLAPPRETLNIFGGNLSIDDFRNVPDGMSHVITYPPMVSDIPIQEFNMQFQVENINQSKRTQLRDVIKSENKELRLKRSKPYKHSSTTLEDVLQIKKVSSEMKKIKDFSDNDQQIQNQEKKQIKDFGFEDEEQLQNEFHSTTN